MNNEIVFNDQPVRCDCAGACTGHNITYAHGVTHVIGTVTFGSASAEERAQTAESRCSFLEQNERAYLALLDVDNTFAAVHKITQLQERAAETTNILAELKEAHGQGDWTNIAHLINALEPK